MYWPQESITGRCLGPGLPRGLRGLVCDMDRDANSLPRRSDPQDNPYPLTHKVAGDSADAVVGATSNP